MSQLHIQYLEILISREHFGYSDLWIDSALQGDTRFL
jgi:hypothetical protein